jgi:hypothetical protein
LLPRGSPAEWEAAPAAVARIALGARGAELPVGGDHGGRCDDMAAHGGVLAAASGHADRELLVGNRVAAAVHDAGDRDGGVSAELGRRRLLTRSAHGPHSATGPPSRRLPHMAPPTASSLSLSACIRKRNPQWNLQLSSARASAGAVRSSHGWVGAAEQPICSRCGFLSGGGQCRPIGRRPGPPWPPST